MRYWSIAVMLAGAFSQIPKTVDADTLEEQLLAESPAQLAADARELGDPRRGAIVFYQPFMSCRTCHDVDDPAEQLGPNLSRWEEPLDDAQLVDAVLRPSKSIRKGYESLTVLTVSGQPIVGLVVEDGDPIVLRDPSQPGKLHTLPRDELVDVVTNENSLMPQSLASQLSSRQQFLDLLRYLIEIRDGGPLAARNLQPAAHLYAAQPLPEYEKSIDHAGMIAALDRESFQRGEAIYQRLCVNCHGTHDEPGSLPTSLRFADGQFKNGSDPYTMYQTLTRGFGMMQPQTWMVPQQKYDVIHYIRDSYLKPHNPSQYFEVSDDWLAGLPSGDSRGPSPQHSEPWVDMDYGRTLIHTYEVGSDASNIAQKGIAVRLDPGPGGVSRGRHWMIFEHDTLRMAGAWTGTGFVDWRGIQFDGQHGIHPHVVGRVQAENKTGPGWAHPETGSWDDVRLVGRDERRYGPLPRDWGQYEGLYHHGNEAIIAYRVGDVRVLERPRLIAETPRPVYGRQLQVGPRPSPLTLQVAQLAPDDVELWRSATSSVLLGPATTPAEDQQQSLKFDGRSYAEVTDVDEAGVLDLTGSDFTITARLKTTDGGALLAKTAPGPKWVPDGKALFVRDGRLVYDIGWVGAVESQREVADGRWHDVALTWDSQSGQASLWIDGKPDNDAELRPSQPRKDQVVRLGFTAADFPDPSYFRGDLESISFYASKLAPEELAGASHDVEPQARWRFPFRGDVVHSEIDDRFAASVVRGEQVEQRAPFLLAGIEGSSADFQWRCDQGAVRLTLPAGEEPLDVTVWFSALESREQAPQVTKAVLAAPAPRESMADLLGGGPARFPEVIETEPSIGADDGPFAADVLSRPASNPWLAQVRLTGFDYFDGGDSLAICSWDGDVWKVDGVDQLDGPLRWRRIASGLFQPLGVRIVEDDVYVTCRDQLVILRDLNGDGETDFYECFNSDHQVTEHFHEFAMGLQTDEAGNFYYAKSARHALPALVPHHGTLLRVSADGERTEILANGFRAANGVCLNPDGTFIVTDQEGHWNPKNRINWVHEGGFYGNMMGYHDVIDASDESMEQPLCWITNEFDRSPAELLWVPQGNWGPLAGSLLNLSYGYGKVYVVPHEQINGQMQGGMCELPLPQFPTGIIRGRFHPRNGQLYTCGMYSWAGNQQQPGGFYRIRATGKPMYLPVGLHATKTDVEVTFTDPLDRAAAENVDNYSITAWDLKRTANYGSDHYNERTWPVRRAALSADGKTVTLEIPNVAPTWGMEIRCFLETPDAQSFERQIHNTIHNLGENVSP